MVYVGLFLILFLIIVVFLGIFLEVTRDRSVITVKEFCEALNELYDFNLVDFSSQDVLTQKSATEILHLVSIELGYEVKWCGGEPEAFVTRDKAAYYIALMIHCCKNGALDPTCFKR